MKPFRHCIENAAGAALAQIDPEQGTALLQMRAAVAQSLLSLAPLEERILRERFGIGSDGSEKTYEEIGRALGLSRWQVRQVEARALRALKHPAKGLGAAGYGWLFRITGVSGPAAVSASVRRSRSSSPPSRASSPAR